MFLDENIVEELLEKSRTEDKSIKEIIDNDSKLQNLFSEKARFIVNHLFYVLDDLFVKGMLIDRAITINRKKSNVNSATLEDTAAEFIAAWELMQPFYSIEGFVGSEEIKGESSLESGTLDLLEKYLPLIDEEGETGRKIILCLSSIIGRDTRDVKRCINVLRMISNTNNDKERVNEEEILNLLKSLRNSNFETTREIASFFNSFIRFHNWMELRLKSYDENLGDVYDSVCVPAKNLANTLQVEEINKIKDATSPKGIASCLYLEQRWKEEKIKEVRDKANELKKRLKESIRECEKELFFIEPEDPAFYHSLVGGKAQGLKYLLEAKRLLNLKIEIPRFIVISKYGVENIEELERKIEQTDLSFVGIVRSSAIGEDFINSFAGVFDSVEIENQNQILDAIKKVISSYNSERAKKVKRDFGVPENSSGGVILQERIAGKGIVVNIRDENDTTIVVADSPREAVSGKGRQLKGPLEYTLKESGLEEFKEDLIKLYETFGPLDMELVMSNSGTIYAVQMRRIPRSSTKIKFPEDKYLKRRIYKNISDLPESLEEEAIIIVNDYLNENMNKLIEFISRNKNKIRGIEAYDNEASHAANIVTTYGIPYRKLVSNNDI